MRVIVSQPVQNMQESQGLLPRIAISKRPFERKKICTNKLLLFSFYTRERLKNITAYIIFTSSQLTRACVLLRSLLCSIFIQWINLFVNVNLEGFSSSRLRMRSSGPMCKANNTNSDNFNNGHINYLPKILLKQLRRNCRKYLKRVTRR